MPAVEKVRPLTRNATARRIAEWINDRHEGNVRAAARAAGVDHVTLWRAATGRFTVPPYAACVALAAHTGRPLEWWLTGREP